MKRHEIRSRATGALLHVVLRADDFEPGREDISDPVEALQLSVIATPAGTLYRAHRHIPKAGPRDHITQETWIVVRGVVEAIHYDLDGTLLESSLLHAGDCSITYAGGHGYRIVTDDARVYEAKSGPYLGAAMDKVAI